MLAVAVVVVVFYGSNDSAEEEVLHGHLYQPALSETHCRLASATARQSHCEESLRGD